MATPAEIEALLTQPEGIDLEYKNATVAPQALRKAIAAFANTRGGTIIVGVDERRDLAERVVGVEPQRFERLVDQARRGIDPQPEVKAFCVPIRDKQVGVIRVDATAGPSVLVDGQVWARTGEATIRTANAADIMRSLPVQSSEPAVQNEMQTLAEMISKQSALIEGMRAGQSWHRQFLWVVIGAVIGAILSAVVPMLGG